MSWLGATRFGSGARDLPVTTHFCAWGRWLFFPKSPQHFVKWHHPVCYIQWVPAREQHIKNSSQRINVRSCVDVSNLQIGLFRTHVSGGADEMAQLSKDA